MEKSSIIKLTLALYQVSELFPEEEPLKAFSREKANEILVGTLLVFLNNPLILDRRQKKRLAQELFQNIEILQGYFEIAKHQNWVDKRNFYVLEREYGAIKEEISESGLLDKISGGEEGLRKEEKAEEGRDFRGRKGQEKKTGGAIGKGSERERGSEGEAPTNLRHKKILEVLRGKGKAQIWELKGVFPQVSKRTLRRDFDYLLSRGFVERIGDGKNTFYKTGPGRRQ